MKQVDRFILMFDDSMSALIVARQVIEPARMYQECSARWDTKLRYSYKNSKYCTLALSLNMRMFNYRICVDIRSYLKQNSLSPDQLEAIISASDAERSGILVLHAWTRDSSSP